MGLTERHWFEDEEPKLTEWQLEDAIQNSEESYKAGYLARDNEIVRCKDCKNWVGNGADIDKLPYWLPCKGEMRQPDYFCADGKRR